MSGHMPSTPPSASATPAPPRMPATWVPCALAGGVVVGISMKCSTRAQLIGRSLSASRARVVRNSLAFARLSFRAGGERGQPVFEAW